MDTKEIINQLYSKMSVYDWFAGSITLHPTLHKALIVYVNRMDQQILTTIPDQFEGFNIVAHFISSVSDRYIRPLSLDRNAN